MQNLLNCDYVISCAPAGLKEWWFDVDMKSEIFSYQFRFTEGGETAKRLRELIGAQKEKFWLEHNQFCLVLDDAVLKLVHWAPVPLYCDVVKNLEMHLEKEDFFGCIEEAFQRLEKAGYRI